MSSLNCNIINGFIIKLNIEERILKESAKLFEERFSNDEDAYTRIYCTEWQLASLLSNT